MTHIAIAGARALMACPSGREGACLAFFKQLIDSRWLADGREDESGDHRRLPKAFCQADDLQVFHRDNFRLYFFALSPLRCFQATACSEVLLDGGIVSDDNLHIRSVLGTDKPTDGRIKRQHCPDYYSGVGKSFTDSNVLTKKTRIATAFNRLPHNRSSAMAARSPEIRSKSDRCKTSRLL